MFYVPLETLGAFVLTCLVIELTPGPNMAYLAILSASHGRRAGFAATLGIALGLLLVGIAAAFGLAALISESPALYGALRWGGVAFLLWLAWDGWQESTETMPSMTDQHEFDKTVFMRGLMTNLLNPKAAVFYVAVLPTFVEPSQPLLWQTVALSLVYVVIATGIHATIVTTAARARPFLENPVRHRFVRRGLALALAAIAVWFAFKSAR
jgi:threonine/homoserine/homoserine lactone efflux protein